MNRSDALPRAAIRTLLVAFAVLALVAAAFAVSRPVLAQDDPPGNNGTVKIHEGDGESDPLPANDPKVCTFHVHAFGFDDGQELEISIYGHGGPNAGPDSYSETLEVDEDGNGRTDVIELDEGMYKLDVDTGDEGVPVSAGDKHKVFKVECEKEEPEEEDHAALKILKLEEDTDEPLEGAIFEIDGMDGTFETDEDGEICITGLEEDSEWTVREIEAPDGYEIIDAEQTVEVDNDGDCDSPDAVFYNRPEEDEEPSEDELGSVLVAKVDEADELLAGATFEIDGVEITDDDDDGWFCADGFDIDATVTVEETVAPDGYVGHEGVEEVTVSSDLDCDERVADATSIDDADLIFVNVPEGEQPAASPTPGEGVLPGNPPVPDTAMNRPADDASTRVVVALMLLAGLGAAGTMAATEARRRR